MAPVGTRPIATLPYSLPGLTAAQAELHIASFFVGIETVVETNFITLSCEGGMNAMSHRHVGMGR